MPILTFGWKPQKHRVNESSALVFSVRMEIETQHGNNVCVCVCKTATVCFVPCIHCTRSDYVCVQVCVCLFDKSQTALVIANDS